MPQSAFDALHEYMQLKHQHALLADASGTAASRDASRDAALARLRDEVVDAARRLREGGMIIRTPHADTTIPALVVHAQDSMDEYEEGRLQSGRDVDLINAIDVSDAATALAHPIVRETYRELVDSLEIRWTALDRPRTAPAPVPVSTPGRRRSIAEDARTAPARARRRSLAEDGP
jgi:hypothetical protein